MTSPGTVLFLWVLKQRKEAHCKTSLQEFSSLPLKTHDGTLFHRPNKNDPSCALLCLLVVNDYDQCIPIKKNLCLCPLLSLWSHRCPPTLHFSESCEPKTVHCSGSPPLSQFLKQFDYQFLVWPSGISNIGFFGGCADTLSAFSYHRLRLHAVVFVPRCLHWKWFFALVAE